MLESRRKVSGGMGWWVRETVPRGCITAGTRGRVNENPNNVVSRSNRNWHFSAERVRVRQIVVVEKMPRYERLDGGGQTGFPPTEAQEHKSKIFKGGPSGRVVVVYSEGEDGFKLVTVRVTMCVGWRELGEGGL